MSVTARDVDDWSTARYFYRIVDDDGVSHAPIIENRYDHTRAIVTLCDAVLPGTPHRRWPFDKLERQGSYSCLLCLGHE